MFEEMTFETVLERMLDRIDDAYDKRESSPIYAAIAPAALEIVNLYAALGDMMDESFADTASREYLIRLAASRGMKPKAATKAIALAEFTPDTVELAEDAEFTAEEGFYRVAGKISPGRYKLECKTPGEIGNLYTGQIIPVDYISGLETAEITGILSYGEDEEGTESFRSRYMASFEADEFGGNKNDYINRALMQRGVGAVKVEPVWNGAGTVRLVILGADFRKASAETVEETQRVFDPDRNGLGDGLAPIGHVVTVETVEEIPVSVTAGLTFDNGYSWGDCKEKAEAAVEAYFSELRRDWSGKESLSVRISGVNTAVLSVEGILDIENTRLNGIGGNLSFGKYEIPASGGVECG